tara:strand:- start:449 stop:649 length:201 start_codon:yes stop_codon:yes gene_type:complete
MARKIRLIEDEADVEEEGSTDSATFTISEKQKLMKTLEATDWKLWEIYQIAEGFRLHFDITKPEIK